MIEFIRVTNNTIEMRPSFLVISKSIGADITTMKLSLQFSSNFALNTSR